MALNVGELVGYLSVDDSKWDSGLAKAQGDLGRLGTDGAKKANHAGALIGGAIGAGFLLAAAKAKDFATGSVDAFAAVEDATGAASVQFGKGLPQVLAFADKASASFGLSKRAALEAQNTFGTLGKAAGLQGAPLAGFSGKLASLAGDMASFKGTSTEQAIEAVGAALRGEMEPIRAYGVLLDDQTLREEALRMGLIKTVKEGLTPQQKALAAQSAILKQTKDAQGDYARTSTSTANVQKTLAAETENAQVALGQKLAPAVTWVRQQMLTFVGGLSVAVDKTSELVGWVQDHSGALTAAGVVIGVITAAVVAHNLVMAISSGRLQAWILQTAIVRGATATWAAGQWLLNAALTANPIGLVIAGIVLLIGGIVLIATKTTWFQTAWTVMTDALAAAWQWLWNSILAPIIRFVLGGFATITDGIANMLSVLSNIPGFGWAKDAADKMAGAADKAHALAKGITDIPDRKDITVTLAYLASTSLAAQLGGANKRAGMAGRAHGGPVTAGMPYVVGDGGRPELFVPDTNGMIIPSVPSVPKIRGLQAESAPAAMGGFGTAGFGAKFNVEQMTVVGYDPDEAVAKFGREVSWQMAGT